MKLKLALLLLPILSGCVSIDLPGVVSDTAKVTKEAYRSVAGKNGEPESTKSSNQSMDTLVNTYIGKENQTVGEVKQACVNEAATKLSIAVGKEVSYTVVDVTLSTVNNLVAATCRLSTSTQSSTRKP